MASKTAVRNVLMGSVLALLGGVLAWRLFKSVSIWQVRRHGARISNQFPDSFVPWPLRVVPPPEREYVGVWDRSPESARELLVEEYGFEQTVPAFLHAYERDGRTRYETASCAYRPEGATGDYQLHVRLFPTSDGRTDVWCHWERNPKVAPLAHIRQEGYDPAEGKQRLRELLDNVSIE